MDRSLTDRRASVCAFIVVFIFAAAAAFSGRSDPVHAAVTPIPATTPIYSGYKGVKIGMTMEEARKLLGNPKEKSDAQDYFVFSDNESAQVVYDANHNVTIVSVTYMGKSSSRPTPLAVFGQDGETKPDGSISIMVRYPKDGISISYNKTAGDDPLVMVTVQKIFGGPE
ncbi:MAG: hypothetical protein ACRD43_14960, partial [Pyrinomonadaceae bacterium]